MILDFNFPVKDFSGRELNQAAPLLQKILEGGINTDERYLDKINAWGKALNKDGKVECDAVDAKELLGMVVSSQAVINVVKISLKDFLNNRIKVAEKAKK